MGSRKDLVLDVKEATVIINKKIKASPTQKWTISTTGISWREGASKQASESGQAGRQAKRALFKGILC